MKGLLSALVVGGATLVAACSSVQVPAEQCFALLPVTPAANSANATIAAPVVEVLRVFDLQVVGAVDRDYLTAVDGAHWQRREFDRWVAPVDRLITDAVVVGLSRRGVASLIKGAVDPGLEQCSLHGRILEFAEMRAATGNVARVAVELWLFHGDQLLFREEFAETEPLVGHGSAAAVGGLSKALDAVLGQLELRLRGVLPLPQDDPSRPAR